MGSEKSNNQIKLIGAIVTGFGLAGILSLTSYLVQSRLGVAPAAGLVFTFGLVVGARIVASWLAPKVAAKMNSDSKASAVFAARNAYQDAVQLVKRYSQECAVEELERRVAEVDAEAQGVWAGRSQ